MSIKENLFELSRRVSVGNITEASDYAFKKLSEYSKCERMSNQNIICFLKGENDYTIMLDAHIDQIAMIITDIDDEGFLTVQKSGGIDLRTLPARPVTIHGKKDICGVFCSIPPHLSSGEIEYDDISKLKIDSGLSDKLKDFVKIGDYVTFKNEPTELLNGRVTGCSFDDRSGVAVILEVAKRLSSKKLPVNLAFVLSDGEELGMRGIRTATFKVNPNEGIAIDVSFGDGPSISLDECGIISNGPMIGVSASLDKNITNRLIKICDDEKIPYQIEAMGDHTGTNADMISITREGVKACTVSIPLRNMHTDVELLDIKDLETTADLLEKYILQGGVLNA